MDVFPMLVPEGWPVTLENCRPGAILVCPVETDKEPLICFKSEYRTDAGKIEAYNGAGEFLCIEPGDLVQPITIEWNV